MIVHHDGRWVYVGVPKTASTALHAWFLARGGVAVGSQHHMEVPEALRGYRVFATSMNPYRRAFSLWRMLRNDVAKGAGFAGRAPSDVVASFPAYVERVLRGPVRIIPLYDLTIQGWLARLPGGVRPEVVPVERLDAGLRRLGVLGPRERVPVRNVTRGGDWLAAYEDPAVAEAVRAWAAEDFDRFGYPTQLATWRRRVRLQRLGARAGAVTGRAGRRLRALAGRRAEAGS